MFPWLRLQNNSNTNTNIIYLLKVYVCDKKSDQTLLSTSSLSPLDNELFCVRLYNIVNYIDSPRAHLDTTFHLTAQLFKSSIRQKAILL